MLGWVDLDLTLEIAKTLILPVENPKPNHFLNQNSLHSNVISQFKNDKKVYFL